MSQTTATAPTRAATPALGIGVLIACAVLCAALAMGLRNTFGLFLAPMTEAHGWTASGFAFAIALQVLLNGVCAAALRPARGPLRRARGDHGRRAALRGRHRSAWRCPTSLAAFTFFAGVMMGIAVSAAGMPVIIASLTRLLPEKPARPRRRARHGRLLLRAVPGGAAGRARHRRLRLAGGAAADGGRGAADDPARLPLNDNPAPQAGPRDEQTARQALSRAAPRRRPSGTSSPASSSAACMSLPDRPPAGLRASCDLPVAVGAGAIGLIGLFNIAGSLGAGELTPALEAAGAAGRHLRRARRADGLVHAGGRRPPRRCWSSPR